MVVIESDDGVVRAGGAVVERVLHALLEPVGFGDAQQSHPDDGPVVVGGLLVPEDDHVVCHPCVVGVVPYSINVGVNPYDFRRNYRMVTILCHRDRPTALIQSLNRDDWELIGRDK
jgi:hypothetical protein